MPLADDDPPPALPPALCDFWKAVDTFPSSSRTSSETALNSDVNAQTLGLLFIIIDDFPNELLWRTWLQQFAPTQPQQVKLWFHAKHPERTSPFVRARLVRSFQLRPEWGSIELTKTMLLLLHEAAQEAPHINKFAFLSESCIPLLPLQETLNAVYSGECAEVSWLGQLRDSPNNGYAKQQQFDVLARAGMRCVLKSDQWLLLSAHHARRLFSFLQHTTAAPQSEDSSLSAKTLLLHGVFRLFQGVRASDEVFFPTLLALLLFGNRSHSGGELNEDLRSNHITSRRLTYCDWSESARNPKSFRVLEAAAVALARQERCVFFRKIQFESIAAGGEKALWDWHTVVYGKGADKSIALAIIQDAHAHGKRQLEEGVDAVTPSTAPLAKRSKGSN